MGTRKVKFTCSYLIVFFSGLLCTVGLAYLIHSNWRLLQAAYTAPALLFLVYWWIAPESGHRKINLNLIANCFRDKLLS